MCALVTGVQTCALPISPVTAPMYALVEGLFLGGISAVFEAKYPGIAFQAVLLTFGTLFALLMAYRSGLIKATERSEEHTSELQSLMRISYAVFCLKKKRTHEIYSEIISITRTTNQIQT